MPVSIAGLLNLERGRNSVEDQAKSKKVMDSDLTGKHWPYPWDGDRGWKTDIFGNNSADLPRQLSEEKIEEKRPGMVTKEVLFHQDKAPAHILLVAMAAIHDCGFQCVPHPLYSLDLVSSEFHLFLNMEKDLDGGHFVLITRTDTRFCPPF